MEIRTITRHWKEWPTRIPATCHGVAFVVTMSRRPFPRTLLQPNPHARMKRILVPETGKNYRNLFCPFAPQICMRFRATSKTYSDYNYFKFYWCWFLSRVSKNISKF
jgi:hypothetical protein